MNLFLDNGHLTDEGLQALIDGNLDEMQRLEVSEHLSFCDECLVRYTNLLTDPICIEPENDLVLPVMRRLRQKILRIVTSRYATAAAAVVLTLCLWAAGFFSGIHPTESQIGQQISQQSIQGHSFSNEIQQVFWGISNTFSNMMNQVSGNISDSIQKDKTSFSNNQSQKQSDQQNDKRFHQKGE